MTLEQACGLHERISFLYVVDGYICTLSDQEGERELFTAKGETLQEALDGLRELVRPYSSKEEMKRVAQIRIEAEAIGAQMWQAGREISFLPDLQYQSEDRVVRARLCSGKPSVQNIPKSEPVVVENLKRKREYVKSQQDIFAREYGLPGETIEQASKRVAQGIEPHFQEKHTRRVRELEAVQEQLMADVEEAVGDLMMEEDCRPDHVTHD